MSVNKAIVIRIISSLFLLGSLVTTIIYVNEGRKEVIALCGNFIPGVAKASVIRQLDTGTFLHYKQTEGQNEKRIHVSSLFTLNIVSCDITLNSEDKVISVISSHSL